jgi:hypothetical protein
MNGPSLRLVGSSTTADPPTGGHDTRPEVRLTTDTSQNVDALDEALGAHAGDVYQRDMELVEVISEKRPAMVADGTPVLRRLGKHSLELHISRHLQPVRWAAPDPKAIQLAKMQGTSAGGKWQPCRAQAETAVLPMLQYGRWKHIRPISAITEAPLFRPDGTILQEAGYDAATGYLYRPNAEFPQVPEHPTQEDARRALVSLQHVFCDFPYTTTAAAAVPIACLLTILARAAIAGPVPVFAFEASIQGSGKTLQGDICHIIATGRHPPKSSFPEDDADQRKELFGLALSGCPVAFFDNVKGLFGGGSLEGLVTSNEITQRELGGSAVKKVPWLATIIVTGNNMRMSDDMVRRALMCRIEPDVEDPTKRKAFAHHDLPGWVHSERRSLIVAALTILRAYAVKGWPDAGAGTMQSFYHWSKVVPGAIMFAGGPNVIETAGTADMGSDEASAVATIIRLLHPVCGQGAMTSRQILDRMYAASGQEAAELKDAVESLCPPRGHAEVSPKGFGMAMKAHKGQVAAGHRVVLQRDAKRKVDMWRVVAVAPTQTRINVAPLREEPREVPQASVRPSEPTR